MQQLPIRKLTIPMCRCEETVKERGLYPESLTLFSNDWFDLMGCVNLFTHLTYIRYIE